MIVSLLSDALARARREPAFADAELLGAHYNAVASGERVLVVQLVRVGKRVGAQAWTQPRNGGSDRERFELLRVEGRTDDDWSDERGC
jgi:hypothetical protein